MAAIDVAGVVIGIGAEMAPVVAVASAILGIATIVKAYSWLRSCIR